MKRNHIIQKQVIELSLPAMEDFLPVSDAFRNMMLLEMMPGLAVRMDQIVSDNEVVIIDELKIDLGKIRWENQQARIADLAINLVMQEIEQALEKQNLPAYAASADQPLLAADLRQWIIWAHYLKTGVLPWFATRMPEKQEWEAELLSALTAKNRIKAVELIHQVLYDITACRRLLAVFSVLFIDTILEASGRISSNNKKIIGYFTGFFHATAASKETIEKFIFEIMLSASVDTTDDILIVTLFDKLICRFPQLDWANRLLLPAPEALLANDTGIPSFPAIDNPLPVSVQRFLQALRSAGTEYEFRTKPGNGMEEMLKTFFSSQAFVTVKKQVNQKPVERKQDEEKQPALKTDRLPYLQKAPLQDAPVPDPLEYEQPDQRYGREPNEKEPLYIAYAGLVLVSPFLPSLFEAAGLQADGKFYDREKQETAVRLTGYLATGNADMPDWDLVVAKILCGLLPHHTLWAAEPLAETLLQEGTDLLHAVIRHWAALGNSSIAALREGFLYRSGKLTETANGWLLQMESQTIDILLGKLPWGYGSIKLPWMPHLLTTEW